MPSTPDRPPIVTWQHRYCGFMSAVYVFCIAMGAFMLAFRNEGADERHSAAELAVTGAILIAVGVTFSIAYGLAPFMRPAPWLWVYDLVLIGLGLTSVCCLPICIPLLIVWIKPDTKAYFGRS
jgi:hypothetical protein